MCCKYIVTSSIHISLPYVEHIKIHIEYERDLTFKLFVQDLEQRPFVVGRKNGMGRPRLMVENLPSDGSCIYHAVGALYCLMTSNRIDLTLHSGVVQNLREQVLLIFATWCMTGIVY